MSTTAFDRPSSNVQAYQTPGTVKGTGVLSMSEAAMMAAIFDGCSSAHEKNDADILINTLQLVEPRRKMHVPNDLLETKIYSTIGKNAVVHARPAVLNFAGFHVGQSRHLKLELLNASDDVQRMHIIPPQTKYFCIKYTKQLRLVPGLAISCVVEFCPDECRYYYDCIRVHCKGEDNLIIPIHAYPVLNTSEYPKIIDFSRVPVGETKTRVFPLRSVAPVDFEFRFTVLDAQSAFSVQPVAGIVPANGEVDIVVSFKPVSFQTSTGNLQLEVIQFSTKPLVCKLLGRSAPGLTHDECLKSMQECPPSTKTSSSLDPSLVSPLALARSRRKAKSSTVQMAANAVPAPELCHGLLFPPSLDSTHAVSWVLNQKTGQLKTKYLQEAMQQQRSGLQPMSRQMKEAQFVMAIRDNVQDERQNQLRWQIKHGEDLPTAEYQVRVIDDRIEDWRIYKRNRGDANWDEECRRTSTEVCMRRTHRDASTVASAIATFDAYSNDMWAARRSVLARFQQAACTIIVRNRVMPRLRKLQKYLSENRPLSDADSCRSVSRNTAQPESGARFVFSATNVACKTFPFYVSPTAKDDLAVDALGPVSTVPIVLDIDPIVPYYQLQVPQYYKQCGYKSFNVDHLSMRYEQPVPLDRLRRAPEEPSIMTEPAEPAAVDVVAAERTDSGPEIPCCEKAVDLGVVSAQLIPPPALFKPIKYPPLHIFNPAPGLMTMLSPLPYSETDPDYHVCPLPRFTDDCDVTCPPSLTQKQFLNRQEIIKGVMTWKKFASPSIASTANVPSLSNVWVPRWNDSFNEELLPTGMPVLKSGLDQDDETCGGEDLDECTEPVQLTMQMVHAEFAAMEAACTQDDSAAVQDVATTSGKKNEEKSGAKVASHAPTKAPEVSFPLGNKLPLTNVPTSDNGPLPRVCREADLDVFLQRKRDILGRKINLRVTTIDRLKKDESLILK